jgi:hypothetical protein
MEKVSTQHLNEQLLARIDFGLLISITATLFSTWYFQLTDSIGGTWACTYMLMGGYLCYNKGKFIFNSTYTRSRITEYTAWLFFYTWPYVLLYILASTIASEYFSIINPWIGGTVIFFIILLIIFKNKSFKIIRDFYVIVIWYTIACVFTMILVSNVEVETDKDFYNYSDVVYVSVPNTNQNVNIVGFVDEAQNIISAKKIKDGIYSFPAVVAYDQNVFAIIGTSHSSSQKKLFFFTTLEDDEFGDEKTIRRNLKHHSSKIKLNIKVRSEN